MYCGRQLIIHFSRYASESAGVSRTHTHTPAAAAAAVHANMLKQLLKEGRRIYGNKKHVCKKVNELHTTHGSCFCYHDQCISGKKNVQPFGIQGKFTLLFVPQYVLLLHEGTRFSIHAYHKSGRISWYTDCNAAAVHRHGMCLKKVKRRPK